MTSSNIGCSNKDNAFDKFPKVIFVGERMLFKEVDDKQFLARLNGIELLYSLP
jgi:hypothetical protein